MSHAVQPVPVDLYVTGEVVGHICRTCWEPCTTDGRHLAPPIRLVPKYGKRRTTSTGPMA